MENEFVKNLKLTNAPIKEKIEKREVCVMRKILFVCHGMVLTQDENP